MRDILDRLIDRDTVGPENWQQFVRKVSQLHKDAHAEIERLRKALDMYRDAASIDVKMEGPRYMGCNSSAYKRAWEADADKFK